MEASLKIISGFLQHPLNEQKILLQKMISRTDLHFLVILDQLPSVHDFNHSHITLCLRLQDEDLSLLNEFLHYPCAHRELLFSPLRCEVDIESYLNTHAFEKVSCSGDDQSDQLCRYEWILSLHDQCLHTQTAFRFLYTGNRFEKDGKLYTIPYEQQKLQACKAGLDIYPRHKVTQRDHASLFIRLSRSTFRSSFSLKQKDIDYINKKGMDVIHQHARDMIATRLAPAVIPNDGKQTPMKGHPVFIAQHATGTCCRGCLEKWHGIAPGVQMSPQQQEYVVSVIMEWIQRQLDQR